MVNQQLSRILICSPKHSKYIRGIPNLCTLSQRNTKDKKITVKEIPLLATNSITQQA